MSIVGLVIVIILIIVFVAFAVYSYMYPKFPNVEFEPYELLLEAEKRPKEFARYCKNIKIDQKELLKEARETFDKLGTLEKIEKWEILKSKDKTEIEGKMTDEEKELLKKHIEDVEEMRQLKMAADIASFAFSDGHHHHHYHSGPGFHSY